MKNIGTANIDNLRYAGMLYLIVAIIAGFAIITIPNGIMVDGDSAATANKFIEAGWMRMLG